MRHQFPSKINSIIIGMPFGLVKCSQMVNKEKEHSEKQKDYY